MTFSSRITAVALAAFFAAYSTVAIAAAEPAKKPATEAAAAKSRPVKVKIGSWEDVQKRVQAKKGQVVVVNIWTNTCLTCLEEFPHFAALRKEFPRKDLALVSVNCDYDGIPGKPPEYYRPDVLKFLGKQNATFNNFMLDISLLDFLEKVELASTPCLYVYGPDGKLAKRFDNDDALKIEDEFTMEDVNKLVGQLVKQKAK